MCAETNEVDWKKDRNDNDIWRWFCMVSKNGGLFDAHLRSASVELFVQAFR